MGYNLSVAYETTKSIISSILILIKEFLIIYTEPRKHN